MYCNKNTVMKFLYSPFFILLIISTLISGCSNMKPIPTVPQVDLPRFMGDWYVIANIPTWLEKGAHNAVETYQLKDDGRIATTFTFNADSFTGERKQYNPTGFVSDTGNNASWGMQFIWPFKAEYKVIYLDNDYQHTIIGRSKRDYIWIMARQPELSTAKYQELLNFAGEQGYDVNLIKKVPQRWETPAKEGS
uniref:Outer membrane lipoprotein Blc n=1 Tax=uncultured Thiotrichaceae bacterium TaxID=298394 RepID=A0A6S6UI18_9GAMM|nr:MAG: Outer membrane lipoprotein [uncultured Thiotrichaceae bacterium]